MLVVAQVALALVLLVSSGLMIRTFQAMRTVTPGFTAPAQVQTVRIAIPGSLVPEPERVARMQQEIVDKLAALPGVTSVGFASAMHMEGIPPNWDVITAEGAPPFTGQMPPLRLFKDVSPGFFRTTGTRMIAGRDYDLDRSVRQAAGRDGLGEPRARAVGHAGERDRPADSHAPTAPWREVIGVVEDVRDNGVHEPAPAIVYWPSFGESVVSSGATGDRAGRSRSRSAAAARAPKRC